MRDFSPDLGELRRRVDAAEAYLRVDDGRARIVELDEQVSRPDLWDDQALARKVTTELARVRDDVEMFDDLQQQVSDLETLAELAREEGDESLEGEIAEGMTKLNTQLD